MTLSGFIVDLNTVSESNLEVDVDCSHLTWSEYKDLVTELEDHLSEIDEKYSARSWLVRGRGLRAKYRRISAEERRRRLTFSPFPSRFQNILKNTRAYLYNLLDDNSLVLETIGTRKLRLLPKHLAPSFVEAVERTNEEIIEPLKRELEGFRQSDDYMKIKQILYKYKIDPTVLDRAGFSVGRYFIDVLPVDFGYSISSDEVYAKMKRAEALKGLEILKKQIERKRREYTLNAISEVNSRIVELTRGLGTKGKVKNAVKKVEKLMEICEDLGLKEVNEKVLKPLKAVCEAKYYQRPMVTKELFGEWDLEDVVSRALKSLFNA
ncbi:MAG: hypothetical protein ACP5KV_04195 [Candidatus Methanomethylicaceae archaeon]